MEHTTSSCHWKLPLPEMSMVEAKFHTVLPVTCNNKVSNLTDVHNRVHCNTNSGAEPNHEHFKWSEDAKFDVRSSQSETLMDSCSDGDRMYDIDISSRPKLVSEKQSDTRNCENVSYVQPYIQHACYICGKCYKAEKKLNLHLIKVHNMTQKCDVCGRSFVNRDILASHKLMHSQGDDMLLQHQCSVCDKKFSFETDLQNHIQSQPNHKNVCKICYKWFSTCEFLNIHQRLHNRGAIPPSYEADDGHGRWMCSSCGTHFHCAFDLHSHINCRHIGELSFVCDLCCKKFTNYYTLRSHRIKHVKRNEQVKPVVKLRTENNLNQSLLNDAQATDESEMPSLDHQKCNVCEELLASDDVLAAHNKMHCQAGSITLLNQQKPGLCSSRPDLESVSDQNSYPVLIGIDTGTITNQENFKWLRDVQSEAGSLGSETLQDSFGDGDVKDDCDVSSKPNLVSEMQNNTSMKSYAYWLHVCPVCDQIFESPARLSAHQIIHEQQLVSTTKLHACGCCGKSFDQRSQLKEHFAVHSSKILIDNDPLKAYKCPDCPRFCKSVEKFQMHIARHISGQLSECDLCGLTFSSFKTLEMHRKVHKNMSSGSSCENVSYVQPCIQHACYICGKCYKAAKKLNLHLIKVHNMTQKCDVCGRSFVNRDILTSHKLMHSRRDDVLLQHQCSVCDKKFRFETDLQNHIRSQPNHKNVCKICYKWFSTCKFLCIHERLHNLGAIPSSYEAHDGHGRWMCSSCGTHFHCAFDLHSHINCRHIGELSFVCDICGKKFTNYYTLRSHRIKHVKRNEQIRPVVKFDTENNLNQSQLNDIQATDESEMSSLDHQSEPLDPLASLTENELNKRLACELVTDVAKSTHDVVIVDLNGPSVISSCTDSAGLILSQGVSVKQDHMAEPSCPATLASKYLKYYVCPYCMKSFRYLQFFQSHLLLHDDSSLCCVNIGNYFVKSNDGCQSQTAVQNMDDFCSSNICGKLRSSGAGCHAHKMVHKQHLKKSHWLIGNSCLCAICGKTFRESFQLRRHEYNVHREGLLLMCEVCEVCGKTFPNAVRLRLHQKRHRMTDNDGSSSGFGLPCSVCHKPFATLSILKGHMVVHQTERPFPCHLCSLRFKIPMQLKAHIKRVHMPKSGLKPFLCRYGCRAFGTAGELRTHLRIHTGEKPFKCASCDKAFITKSDLLGHIAVMHSDVKNFACHVCGRKFALRKDMNRHIKDRHQLF